MTDKQIEIGNKLLGLFVDNDGQMTDIEYESEIKQLFGSEFVKLSRTTTISMIEDYKLFVRNAFNKNFKIITAEGRNAHKIGLKQYIEEFEEKEKLKIENLRASIKTANRSFYLSIAAILIATITLFVNYCSNNTINPRTNTDNNRYNNSNNQSINSDSVIEKMNPSDSINISKQLVH